MRPFLTATENERLLDLCTRWATAHPELSSRLSKARLLVLEGGIVPVGLLVWRVKGSKDWHLVQVNEGKGTCDCTWSSSGGKHCSHILACALWHKLFSGPSPVPPPPSPAHSIKRSHQKLEELTRAHETRNAELRKVALCGTRAA